MLHELDVDISLATDDIKEWTSISLCSSDQVSSKKNKTWYNILARELLIETLIREAKFSNSNSFELSEIPSDFFSLIYTDIIKETNVSIEESSPSTTNERLWKKLQHAHDIQSIKDFQNIFDIATAYKTQKEKTQLIISACNNLQLISKLVQFKHLTKPECITDLSSQTLVHLKQLDDYNAIILATNILIPETIYFPIQAPILQVRIKLIIMNMLTNYFEASKHYQTVST
ncbi:2763_t:CDS:2, partial [Racocetra persica]